MDEGSCYYPGTYSHPITGENPPGMVRSSRDTPPAHFCCRIESFKLLANSLSRRGADKHEMDTFESCGFKWKLALYPRGDERRNGKGHVSLYLVLADADSLSVGSKVIAIFKLFLYDHIRANYMIVERDVSGASIFYKSKTEVGFSRFIPLSTFNDKSSGFKDGESCIFGAEVYVTGTDQEIAKEVCLSNSVPSETFSFVVEISKLLSCEYYDCASFWVRERKWFIRLQTQTSLKGKRYLCFALVLGDGASGSHSFVTRWRRSRIRAVAEKVTHVTGTTRIDNPAPGKHIERNFCQLYKYPKIGDFQKLLKMDYLNDTSKGYVANGKLQVGLHFSSILAVEDYVV